MYPKSRRFTPSNAEKDKTNLTDIAVTKVKIKSPIMMKMLRVTGYSQCTL